MSDCLDNYDKAFDISRELFTNMAECCMLACVCHVILLSALLWVWIKRDYLH